MTCLRIAVWLSVVACATVSIAAEKPRWRRPVDLACSADGRRLYVANRDSGTVSIVDCVKRTVTGEIEVGSRISAFTMPAPGKLLVTDDRKHELIVLVGGGSRWRVVSRLKLAAFPVDVVANKRGDRCYVSSLWSRTVTAVAVVDGPRPGLRIVKSIPLGYAPRKLCLVEASQRLIAADAFGGRLGVIDTSTLETVGVRETRGHNIRGLALSDGGKRLLVAQQSLNPLARSTRDDVHWGNMLSNLLSSAAVRDALDVSAQRKLRFVSTELGTPGAGAGDPGDVVVSGMNLAVALSGVNAIGIGRGHADRFLRVPVGERPTALAVSPDGRHVYVANTLADSISVVDFERARRVATISLGTPPPASLVRRGEALFSSATLSHDGWMSCHSCHTDGHTNGGLNDNLSDGSFGSAKRVLSLHGVAETGPWAWSGKVDSLEQQVRNSIVKTMNGKAPTDKQVAALTAYLRTLRPAPAASRELSREKLSALKRGRALFAKLNCVKCHAPPTYTSPGRYDVGLDDGTGNNRFNPPSLRGVGRRRALFHDGRARSVDEVLKRFRHQLPRALTNSEHRDLVEFLKSL